MQDMGAEDAAVGVQFVDDHVAQAGEEVGPGLVKGKDTRVQHIGGGEEHLRRIGADFFAAIRGGVAVVDLDCELAAEALH